MFIPSTYQHQHSVCTKLVQSKHLVAQQCWTKQKFPFLSQGSNFISAISLNYFPQTAPTPRGVSGSRTPWWASLWPRWLPLRAPLCAVSSSRRIHRCEDNGRRLPLHHQVRWGLLQTRTIQVPTDVRLAWQEVHRCCSWTERNSLFTYAGQRLRNKLEPLLLPPSIQFNSIQFNGYLFVHVDNDN